MKSSAKRRISGQAASHPVADQPSASEDHHHGRIAAAAYFKAEARGFSPGQELDDWLEAEAELQAREAA